MRDEGGEGAKGNLEYRILNDEGDLSCIFLLHRWQLSSVCSCSHCIAVFSYFSIATSTAERPSSLAALERSGKTVRCSTLSGAYYSHFSKSVICCDGFLFGSP
jgi:hypothetical protein